jgi:acetate kinase
VRLREEGDADAELAFDVYCHRLRRYVGAFYAVLGELDAVVFTGGIGERASSVRESALEGMSGLGIVVDPDRNRSPGEGPVDVAADDSRVRVLVVPTNEEWEIARQSLEVAGSAG